jgi:uncharacterized protein YggE
MKKTILAFTILVCSVAAAVAQSAESVRPSVSVIGEANMSVSPDQVVFTFEVVTSNKDVTVAKRDNDTTTARTLKAANSFNISPDDIQTDSLSISPRYTGDKDPRGTHILLGYEVTKRILVTLKDIIKIDDFLAKMIEAGVNRVVDISIENSELRKYEENVRAMAVRNAHAKATSYAKQLGQTVGKAYVIREENADSPGYAQGFGSGGGAGDGVGSDVNMDRLASPALTIRDITFALGKIKVEEKIYVTFELNK